MQKVTEPKWQSAWDSSQSFKAVPDDREKILCLGNVSLPLRAHSHGACEKLHNG